VFFGKVGEDGGYGLEEKFFVCEFSESGVGRQSTGNNPDKIYWESSGRGEIIDYD
jgi:hypothetical protein